MVTLQPIEEFSRIEIDRSPSPALDIETQRRVDAAWSALCARNPNCFNAPILVFDRFDPDPGVIFARVDQYKHHAVRDVVDLGITILAVTACITHPDPRGPRSLLGKRSASSHRYGGLWELGPSGGIEVPEKSHTICPRQLMEAADKEVREEVGLSVRSRPFNARALVHDGGVGSTDIALGIPLFEKPQLRRNWEYDDTRWVTLDELVRWARRAPQELIPTTVALARFLHEARG